MFAPNQDYAADDTRDPFDRAVAAAWVFSEIAVDVFGMFFWGALGLFVLAANG